MTDHWVCSYYDGKNIHIYDSLNIHILHNDYQMYLQRLFPFYSVEQNNVRFPRVHQQQNADDCGVLAIAFGVSLLFRHKPETIEYEYDNLRKHLLNMFETQIITPFPMIKHSDPPLPLPLEEIVKKEHKAYLERTRLDNNAQTATIQSKKKNVSKQPQILKSELPKDDNTYVPFKSSIEIYIQNLTYEILVESIDNLTNETEARLRAEKMVKWCMQARKNYYSVQFKTLQRMIKMADSRLKNMIDDSDIENLCGDSEHTSSSEPYFYDRSYNFNYESEKPKQVNAISVKRRHEDNEQNEMIMEIKKQKKFSETFVINPQGQAVNILPIDTNKKGVKFWSCDSICTVLKDQKLFNLYKNFLQILVTQTLSSCPKFLQQCFITHSEDKLGHSFRCYSSEYPCKSISFFLHLLSPHFSSIRSMLRCLYRLNEYYRKLLKLSHDLDMSNIKSLLEVENEMKKQNVELSTSHEMDCLNEDSIIAENSAAFKIYTKKMMDLPRNHCRSCQRLLFERSLKNINNFYLPIVNPYWDQMEEFFINHPDEKDSDYICDNCLKYFRKSDIPPTCILNNLQDGNVPEEIRELSNYEVMLIQQAKAFQVVQRAGTVQKKDMPHSSRYQISKGQCFHLPLPLSEI